VQRWGKFINQEQKFFAQPLVSRPGLCFCRQLSFNSAGG
jgi:hypothetical protein